MSTGFKPSEKNFGLGAAQKWFRIDESGTGVFLVPAGEDI